MEYVVRIGLSRRAPGLTRTAAQAYWRTVHADVFRAAPKLVSYVQNHAVLIGEDRALIDDCAFDVFAEATFETRQDLAEATASEYYRCAVVRDEANLLVAQGRSFLLLRRAGAMPLVRPGGVNLAAFLSGEWEAAADEPTPTTLERIDEGSGPIGARTRFYAQWRCRSAEDALALYETLRGQRRFAKGLVAATAVRPNIVLAPAVRDRSGAI